MFECNIESCDDLWHIMGQNYSQGQELLTTQQRSCGWSFSKNVFVVEVIYSTLNLLYHSAEERSINTILLLCEGEKLMKWIVLSDLHMNFKNCNTITARDKLIEALRKESADSKISFVLITGDCLHQNKGSVKEIANYISQIADACGIDMSSVILCPGNHDIDRKNKSRNTAIKTYRIDGEMPDVETCLNGYTRFKELYTLLYSDIYEPFSSKIIGNFRIISVDSCLVSMDDRDYGNLVVNFTGLAELSREIQKDKSKTNIVIMHHGVEWLSAEDGRLFQHWLADNNVKAVFCGHNHAPGLSILTEAIKLNGIPQDGISQFTCGCTLSDSYSRPVFLVAEYDKTEAIKAKLYEYRDNSSWEIASGALRSFPSGIYRESTTNGMVKNSYDIPKVYKNIFDIGNDVAQDIKASQKLDFFGLRGGTFLEGASKIANALYEKGANIRCRLLVSDPYSIHIEKRLRNVPEFAPQKKLEEKWKTNYLDIKKLKETFPEIDGWVLRFHEQPLLYRFIITDCAIYLGYYTREPSSKSYMYRYVKESSVYENFTDFFNSSWENANTSFSAVVPDRCSFVLDNFDMKPSLVINLTSSCNMKCSYCPEGGENLVKCDTLCGISQIKYLLTAYADYYRKKKWTEKKVVRITGGEPLLDFERLFEVLCHAQSEDYEKIVLCTNGLLLKQCYEKNPTVWEKIKDILLLKISLDTLKPSVFNKMTGVDGLKNVRDNISFMKFKGFKIELNFVATKNNVDEIESVYNYAHSNRLVGLKVLTVNDFGDRVPVDDVEKELNTLIEGLRKKNYVETGLYVHNNKGIHMKRFIYDGCTLTIVDHMNKGNSITPRRTYSEACQNCRYYPESVDVQTGLDKPCATGIMSLTMRADGMLSFCRMQADNGTNLDGKTLEEVQKMVEVQLKKFEKCYHYEIGEKK